MFSNSNIIGQQAVTPIASNGSISVANTSQSVLNSNSSRGGMIFTNTSNTIMYLEFSGVSATTSGIPINPGQMYEPSFSTTLAVNVICDTVGATYNCSYWNGSIVSGVTTLSASISAASTTSVTVTSSIGTSASILIASNSSRKCFEIFNISASADVFVTFGATAPTTTTGIKIPSGGSYASHVNAVFTGDVRIISTIAATPVTYVEYV